MKRPTKEINKFNKAKQALLKAEQELVMSVSQDFLQYYEDRSIEGMQELVAMLPEGVAMRRRCYEAIITFEKELEEEDEI